MSVHSFQNDLEKRFYTFYILQILVFGSGLARATAIGFILFQLGVSPQQLGLMTAIATCGMLGGYWFTPYLHKIVKYSDVIFTIAQKAVSINSIILIIYTLFCIYEHTWGNFWFWTFMSTVGSFFISIEQSSRPLLVKKNFPTINFARIIRQDVLTMGLAKVLGFATGIFIISKFWVLFIFFIGLLSSIAMIAYINKISKREITVSLQEKNNDDKVIDISYITTICMNIVTSFILFPINTQVITYAKIWHLPFYWFYICGSLGNVFFNAVINPRVGLTLGKAYAFYILCLLIGFSLFILDSYLVLIGSFLVGGAYSSLTTLGASRLYEGTSNHKRSSKLLSRYYVFGSLACIAGSYLLGVALGNFNKNIVFSSLAILSLIFYSIIYMVYNQIKNNKQKAFLLN